MPPLVFSPEATNRLRMQLAVERGQLSASMADTLAPGWRQGAAAQIIRDPTIPLGAPTPPGYTREAVGDPAGTPGNMLYAERLVPIPQQGTSPLESPLVTGYNYGEEPREEAPRVPPAPPQPPPRLPVPGAPQIPAPVTPTPAAPAPGQPGGPGAIPAIPAPAPPPGVPVPGIPEVPGIPVPTPGGMPGLGGGMLFGQGREPGRLGGPAPPRGVAPSAPAPSGSPASYRVRREAVMQPARRRLLRAMS